MRVGLKREVTLTAAIIYGVGIILGAGVYALVGVAAGNSGNALWLSFLLAAMVSSFSGLSYMELISMFPKSAAEYVYVKNAFGSKILAFNVGWIAIFADIVATSAVSLGFAGYFVGTLGMVGLDVYIPAIFGSQLIPVAFGLLAVMSFVNFWGIKESARINTVFSCIEIAGLLFVIFLALYYGRYGTVDYLEMPFGFGGVLSGAALIFFAYIGFEDIANISEEVKNVRKNGPRALISAVMITTIIYVLVGLAVVSLVDWQTLAASRAPLATAVSSILGEKAFFIMSIIAMFATANTVLVGLIVGSREIYGISKDGSIPKALSTIHKERNTPWLAVIAAMLLATSFVLIGHIDTVASITDLGTFYIFISVNAAAIGLRYRKPDLKRPFKAPLNIGKFPVTSLLGLLSAFALATHLDLNAIIIGTGVALGGLVFYFIYNR